MFKIFMEKNTTALILVGLLVIGSLCTAALAFLTVRATGELRGLQMQITSINNNQNIARAVANEAVEYSKRNPSIDLIVQTYGIKPKPAPTNPPPKSAK